MAANDAWSSLLRALGGVLLLALLLPLLTAQQPTFRAGVTLVSTDVIPRDQNGRFVTDLTRENFTVLEDGQPQTITSFTVVHGGRTFNLLLPPPAPRRRRKASCCRAPSRAPTTPPAACC